MFPPGAGIRKVFQAPTATLFEYCSCVYLASFSAKCWRSTAAEVGKYSSPVDGSNWQCWHSLMPETAVECFARRF